MQLKSIELVHVLEHVALGDLVGVFRPLRRTWGVIGSETTIPYEKERGRS
jgi:hypothetical protein